MTRMLLGAIAAVLVLGTGLPAYAETHLVRVTAGAFEPAELLVRKGDTVRWEWVGGVHTVTSGVDLEDPKYGVAFNQPVDADHPVFEYVFTEVGEYPYFSEPALALGVAGTIEVQIGTSVDSQTWGKLKRLFDTTAPGGGGVN
jgi:plastocyanin